MDSPSRSGYDPGMATAEEGQQILVDNGQMKRLKINMLQGSGRTLQVRKVDIEVCLKSNMPASLQAHGRAYGPEVGSKCSELPQQHWPEDPDLDLTGNRPGFVRQVCSEDWLPKPVKHGCRHSVALESAH